MKTINEMLDKNFQSIKKIKQLEESFMSKRYWLLSYLHSKASHLIKEIEDKIKEIHEFDYVEFLINNDEYMFNVFQTGFRTSQRGKSRDWQILSFINSQTGNLMSKYHDIGPIKLTETFGYNHEKHPILLEFLNQKQKEINELLQKELESECSEKIINEYMNGDLI